MGVERKVFKKVAHWVAGGMLLTSLNLPRLVHADNFAFDAKPLYSSGQDLGEKLLLEEKEPIVLDVNALMYHEVTASKLKSDFMNLIAQGYQPISLETFVAAQRGEIVIPKGLKVFMATLDDSRLSQYRSIIEATEYVEKETGWFVPVNVFALTKFEDSSYDVDQISGNTPSYNDGVNSYMTRDQLIDLIVRGHQVQPHTVNHGSLTSLTAGARNAEVFYSDRTVQILWDMAGKKRKVKAFAYPNGRYNGEVLNVLGAMGFDVAFSTVQRTIHSSDKPLEVGRIRKS